MKIRGYSDYTKEVKPLYWLLVLVGLSAADVTISSWAITHMAISYGAHEVGPLYGWVGNSWQIFVTLKMILVTCLGLFIIARGGRWQLKLLCGLQGVVVIYCLLVFATRWLT